MVSKKELQGYSIQELEEFIQSTDREVQKLRQDKVRAHALLDQRNAEEEAARRYETMSDPERRALAQFMEAQGIASEEKAGTPGS